MRILYAIQGTGNGHFSRAREFIPFLKPHGQLDILVSGSNVDVDLGHTITYNKTGISYTFGKNGGIDYVNTLKNLRPTTFIDDMISFPIHNYDVIINDFEPVTAWAARRNGIPCIGLSHQASFLSLKTPRPAKGNLAAEWIFKNYAPCTIPIGFHYLPYDDFIYTPIIRREVRQLKPTNGKHITVYLPAYADDTLINVFQAFPQIEWHIFSKHVSEPYEIENIRVMKVNNEQYLKSLETCFAVISGGGFEAPAESLFLGKKLLVVPMHDQYEQQCNADALKRLGVYVVDTITPTFEKEIETWLDTPQCVELDFPDNSDQIIEYALNLTSSKL